MRVNQTGNNQVQDANAHRTGKSGHAQNAKASDPKRGESASVSDSASASTKTDVSARGKELSRASALAQAAPDVREDKIAELKRRIAEGSYKVDDHAVADRMVDEHLADLG